MNRSCCVLPVNIMQIHQFISYSVILTQGTNTGPSSAWIRLHKIIFFHDGHCGLCVVDGWFKQLHLARITLVVLWGWVRLHTCCALTMWTG